MGHVTQHWSLRSGRWRVHWWVSSTHIHKNRKGKGAYPCPFALVVNSPGKNLPNSFLNLLILSFSTASTGNSFRSSCSLYKKKHFLLSVLYSYPINLPLVLVLWGLMDKQFCVHLNLHDPATFDQISALLTFFSPNWRVLAIPVVHLRQQQFHIGYFKICQPALNPLYICFNWCSFLKIGHHPALD